MKARELLVELDPWLHSRCRFLAAQLPGLGADEIYQQVVEEFLANLDRWLQQDATVDVVAQARTLMSYCLRHVKTRALRDRARLQPLPEVEDGDPIRHLAEPVAPVDSRGAREVLELVRGATTPPCALCLLSLRLPAVVESGDAERAKAWRKGGSAAVPRPIDEAWGIFTEGRSRLTFVADDVAWKDHLGVAWYTQGPVPELNEHDRRTAAGKVERYANRGAEDLRRALLRQEGAE